jgi:hypothetical protein
MKSYPSLERKLLAEMTNPVRAMQFVSGTSGWTLYTDGQMIEGQTTATSKSNTAMAPCGTTAK